MTDPALATEAKRVNARTSGMRRKRMGIALYLQLLVVPLPCGGRESRLRARNLVLDCLGGGRGAGRISAAKDPKPAPAGVDDEERPVIGWNGEAVDETRVQPPFGTRASRTADQPVGLAQENDWGTVRRDVEHGESICAAFLRRGCALAALPGPTLGDAQAEVVEDGEPHAVIVGFHRR